MRLRALLPLLLVLAIACGDDDSSTSPGRPVDVAGTLSNGSSLSDIQTHWSSAGTSGALLLISFLDDGTGQLNFANDDLFSEYSRELHDFTWRSNATGRIDVTIELEAGGSIEFSLLSVSGGLETETMSALLEDEEGALFTLAFSLITGSPPCC